MHANRRAGERKRVPRHIRCFLTPASHLFAFLLALSHLTPSVFSAFFRRDLLWLHNAVPTQYCHLLVFPGLFPLLLFSLKADDTFESEYAQLSPPATHLLGQVPPQAITALRQRNDDTSCGPIPRCLVQMDPVKEVSLCPPTQVSH